MMKKMILMLIIFCAFIVSAADDKAPDINAILDKMDKVYRSNTSEFELEMEIVTPDWQRTMKMKAWSEGMKKTFITILSPSKDKGIGTLKVDSDMWNYFPKVNKVMKVPPSMMMGSWMGSDFTNDDLVKETTFRDDHTAKLLESTEKDIIVIELKPKESAASVWGKIIAKVRKSDYLPVSEDYYDEKGVKVRTMSFSGIKEMGGKIIPSVMEIIPLNKKGNSTKITYLNGKFDIKLDPETFSLRNL
ncbi:MAG TPA: outer membrane lipoprotein-sorting protein, partial [bacterium]|nr:outer membrane lipoprotein-sorting protein [bacterium]